MAVAHNMHSSCSIISLVSFILSSCFIFISCVSFWYMRRPMSLVFDLCMVVSLSHEKLLICDIIVVVYNENIVYATKNVEMDVWITDDSSIHQRDGGSFWFNVRWNESFTYCEIMSKTAACVYCVYVWGFCIKMGKSYDKKMYLLLHVWCLGADYYDIISNSAIRATIYIQIWSIQSCLEKRALVIMSIFWNEWSLLIVSNFSCVDNMGIGTLNNKLALRNL